MNRNEMLRAAVLRLFQKKQKGVLITADQINQLFDSGVISEKTALRYCVKNEFYEMMKGSDISQRSAIIDLEVKWDVSDSYIKRLLYKCPDVKG